MSIRKPDIIGPSGERYIAKVSDIGCKYAELHRAWPADMTPTEPPFAPESYRQKPTDGAYWTKPIERYRKPMNGSGNWSSLNDSEVEAKGYRFLRQTKGDSQWLAEILADEDKQIERWRQSEAEWARISAAIKAEREAAKDQVTA